MSPISCTMRRLFTLWVVGSSLSHCGRSEDKKTTAVQATAQSSPESNPDQNSTNPESCLTGSCVLPLEGTMSFANPVDITPSTCTSVSASVLSLAGQYMVLAQANCNGTQKLFARTIDQQGTPTSQPISIANACASTTEQLTKHAASASSDTIMIWTRCTSGTSLYRSRLIVAPLSTSLSDLATAPSVVIEENTTLYAPSPSTLAWHQASNTFAVYNSQYLQRYLPSGVALGGRVVDSSQSGILTATQSGWKIIDSYERKCSNVTSYGTLTCHDELVSTNSSYEKIVALEGNMLVALRSDGYLGYFKFQDDRCNLIQSELTARYSNTSIPVAQAAPFLLNDRYLGIVYAAANGSLPLTLGLIEQSSATLRATIPITNISALTSASVHVSQAYVLVVVVADNAVTTISAARKDVQ